MQSLRRVAFRSAVSASRTISSTSRSAPFASQVARNVNAGKPVSILPARFFSQTGRVANDVDAVENPDAVASRPTDSAVGRANPDETPHGIFIRNLVFEASDKDLEELFGKFGEIHSATVPKDGRDMSKGWGFVFFKTEEAKKDAIAAMDGTFFHGRRIQVLERTGTYKRKQTSQSAPTDCLYVGNIAYETTDAELNNMFRDLEGVENVRVAVDRTTGWPRGFAHVDFVGVDSAKAALQKLQGMNVGGRELKVDFAGTSQVRRRSSYGDRKGNPAF